MAGAASPAELAQEGNDGSPPPSVYGAGKEMEADSFPHPHAPYPSAAIGPASLSPKTSASTRKKKKQRDEGPMASACAWVVEYQLGLAINLVLLLILTHLCFPRARRHTRKFFELSYYDAETGRYGAGWNDMSMVFYWIVLFTGLRVGVMDFILIPFAQWGGVRNRKGRVRFAEQGWLFFYYGFSWSLGMYIYYNSPYWLNLHEMWTDWPNRQMDGLSKWYYLVQYAFYLDQIFVVNIEERRKDYAQMFTHHIVTCALICASYGYHQTKVGTVILCLMDVVDIILPLAKMLKYLHFNVACDIAFGVFMVTWFVARHVLYVIVIWSVYADSPVIIQSGCYAGKNGAIVGPFPAPQSFGHRFQPFFDPEGLLCWDNQILGTFLSMLLFLEVVALIWFGMIIRVAWRVIHGGTAEDSRSDDECDEEEEEDDLLDEEEQHVGTRMHGWPSDLRRSSPSSSSSLDRGMTLITSPPLEEEVGVEAINLKGRSTSLSRRYKKAASTSGATLPGHSDRKDLLGRIGCDKTA
ncbi:MAG: sphingosine N-acyltransferase lag1 [Thelocarpon superellum]|nr:MAG: sphingosine N-acyltransferase lag1 [Thelocarpon superellum]